MNIETGCKAEIVNSKAGNEGLIVTIGKCLGRIKGINPHAGPRWEVDCKLVTEVGSVVNHVGEYQLRRIDDEDKDTMISWEQMSDLWVPEEIMETC